MDPRTIQHTYNLAVRHHQARRLPQAEALYRQILEQQPDHPEALHNLGVLAKQAGRHDIAIELFGRAIAARPNYADAYSNLGDVLRQTGQLTDAIAACQRAVTLDPNSPMAQSNLGCALNDAGQIEQAVAAFRRAIALGSGLAQPHYNLANALRSGGQHDQAIAEYRQAIALNPKYAEAHSNLGAALSESGRFDEAIVAYHQAIALDPGCGAFYANLGNALKDAGQLDDGMVAYRRAVALDPESATIHSNLVFTLQFAADSGMIVEEHLRWSVAHGEPLRKEIQPHANNRDPERRLRIGYVSPDFCDHVVGRNLMPLFQHYDREQYQFICYANVQRPDTATERFHHLADGWRDITRLSDEQATQQIRDDGIDVLVDSALHMAHNRLLIFARKPAPVQVTFAGYPGSTGLSTIDYRLSDPYLDPPDRDESIYTEQTLRLPDSFWCYDPMECGDIPVNALPALKTGVLTFGCLNSFFKITPAILALWGKVLKQVDGSRLLVLSTEGSHRESVQERLGQEGIDASRVEFVPPQPRRGYLQYYHQIDVGLDSFPYNGHTTSLDSFWMGVPVVTLVGERAVSRAGLCQLSNLGLVELAGQTAEEFVRIAVELARELPRLERMRSTLRARMEQSPLMDARQFARSIELAYRQMWRAYCA